MRGTALSAIGATMALAAASQETGADAVLMISVLGPLHATVGGVSVNLRSRKARAVLAYLALSKSGRETRERLVGLLWSESSEDKARASLRQTLRELRDGLSAAGYKGLATPRETLALDSRTVVVDVNAVLRHGVDGEVHHELLAQRNIMDSFLQDLVDADPAFAQWARAQRQMIHDSILRQLEDGLRRPDVASGARRRICEALLGIDPTHEEACRCVMRGRAEDGDLAGAVRAYDTLWRLLGDEYDSEPSLATQDLAARIKMGLFEPSSATDTRAAAPAPARPTKVALTVESFVLQSIDSARVHLVDGFRRNLIACLVRFREWFVLEGHPGEATPRVARADVSGRYQLAAAAGQLGSIVYLALTLREVDTGLYIWSERFELALNGWFEVQQRVVRRIAMTLNVQLSAERLARLSHEPDVSLTVYDKWLRGQAMLARFDPDVWSRAGQLFAEAAAEAPNFSLAFSSQAEMNNSIHIAHPGIFRDARKATGTLDIARRAVEVDPTDSRAQLCLGWSYAMAKLFPQAAIHMELAAGLNPNDSWTLMSTALFNAFYGELDRALDLARQSLEMSLSPTTAHWAYHVSILFLAGDYEGTIDATDRTQDVIRTMPAWRAASLFHLGRLDEARVDAARFIVGTRQRWFGAMAPNEAAIGRWLLHLYPIRDAANWERLRVGVTGAGIPDAGIRHNDW